MANLPLLRKHRSSTTKSHAPPFDESARRLESSLAVLKLHDSPRDVYQQAQTQLIESFRFSLDAEGHQDYFRRLHGFQSLITSLRARLEFTPIPAETETLKAVIQELAQLLRVLLLAFHDHEGNRRYFARRVEDGGWRSIRILVHTARGLLAKSTTGREFDLLCQPLANTLISLALDDVQLEVPDWEGLSVHSNEAVVASYQDALVSSPEAVPLLVSVVWPLETHDGEEASLFLASLRLLVSLVTKSEKNKQAVASADLADVLLDLQAQLPGLPQPCREAIDDILASILNTNTNSLRTAEKLFVKAMTDNDTRLLLERALSTNQEPPSTHFDLSLHSHSALEIPSLPRVFPPPTGYTLTTWFKIDSFDPDYHLTLFGAFDITQTCFVLTYLERGSQQLILQTSVTSSSPSVRFKKFRFEAAKWYHIALVHKPPRSGDFGEALLFVNGRIVDKKERCLYPQTAPHHDNNASSAPYPPESNMRFPVQAFFGTPQDLSGGERGRKAQSRWSLATAHLYDCYLPTDLIAVHHALGPSYSGNFQDRVGQLLTYDASAALNLFNEELHGDKAERSGIADAIQKRGVDILHEGGHLLSIFSAATIDMDGTFSHVLPLSVTLPEAASRQLQAITRTGNAIILNAYRPLIADALVRPSGVGVLTGRAFVSIPRGVDDASWQLSGFLSIHVKLIETASSADSLLSAIKSLFLCIKHKFRASEAMERDQGYSVVAMLLRDKLGLSHSSKRTSPPMALGFDTIDARGVLMRDILTEVLLFLGIDPKAPSKSLLKNPLAYRSFLTDLDIWRTGSLESQRLFFQQISWLLTDNEHHDFNARRLLKMRVIRRFLDSLRVDCIHESNIDVAMSAMKALYLHVAIRTDYRDMATLIGFCLQESKTTTVPPPANRRLTVRLEAPPARHHADSVSTEQVRLIRSANDSMRQQAVPKGRLGGLLLRTWSDLLCDQRSGVLLKRFSRNVPTSWLVHLLAEPDTSNVGAALTIISRSIVVMGQDFIERLSSKYAGLLVVEARLKSHWRAPTVWYSVLAALFKVELSVADDVSTLAVEGLLAVFPPDSVVVTHQHVTPWLLAMLKTGIEATAPESEGTEDSPERRSDVALLTSVISYLVTLYQLNLPIRDLLGSSQNLRRLLRILYPIITSVPVLSPSAELALIKERANTTPKEAESEFPASPLRSRPTIIRSGSSVTLPELHPSRIRTPRRPSSFVLVDKEDQTEVHLSAHFNPTMAPKASLPGKVPNLSSATDQLLDLVVVILIDHACLRKDFSGFGLYFKAPPGAHDNQAFFESYILQRTMRSLWSHLTEHKRLLQTPRTLTNMAKYSLHMADAVFEGWFIDGAQPLVDFTGNILDYVQQPEIASLKDVRLCSQAIVTIRTVFLRIVLLRLSELDEVESESYSLNFLQQLTYWQTILFAPENQETSFIRLLCYVLYTKLVSSSVGVRSVAAGLFRMLLVQKPTEAATILIQSSDSDQKHLSTGFMKLATSDDEELLQWVDKHRIALDQFFLKSLARHWEEFVESENTKTEESAKNRQSRRQEKLRRLDAEYTAQAETLELADRATGHWRINSHAQDRLKLHRVLQDQQENIDHQRTAIKRQHELLSQPCGLAPDLGPQKWQLDQTEARDRMRMRLLRDQERDPQMYQPKRKASQRVLDLATRNRSASGASSHSATSVGLKSIDGTFDKRKRNGEGGNATHTEQDSDEALLEGDFELVDDPREDEEIFEDKNRKILRSVERGDSIKSVYNMSRIIGLEASESLLIVGKKWLYMRDGMFQRSDGEIVSIENAPPEERDAYIQMTSGRDLRASAKTQSSGDRTDMARSWPWASVLSISKRRFLFRDVALELFFNDGRSYLLTFASPSIRNSVYTDVANQAPHIIGPASSVSDESLWRLGSLRSPEDVSQSFGNKFANVFNSTAYNSASRKWARGEISNFNYLMLINTMAGRTFNDLTQYPVFPWVLADYSSDELDLDDPRSYRDLRKPMGCQQPDREAEFRERYQTFAEMGEERPFHYGTHYSSAMIVTSYLIRLQPFVQSYLLLQGGSFDHADRLFDSIERAWTASSMRNMTDVRELTPEFYYLPEFLTNVNGYNFGVKEGTGQAINDVHLPKWAKGDPHLFIKKHREALESHHVSEHLHEWIDLIFGYKQKGEAAIEAVNVYHPLSYHGAKDLDTIDDPIERLATVGMIHNFGQTPHQLFTKPHHRREAVRHGGGNSSPQHLDTQADTLTKLPRPAAEIGEKVASILYQTNNQRLAAAGACKLFAPPHGRFFAQWQYADNSLRFYDSDSRKLLGLFEELHIGPIATACFVDSKTLLTGGADCTIGVWDVVSLPNERIDLRPRTHLFGHRAPLLHLAVSATLSTLVSADVEGAVLVWDLNRHDCIRILIPAAPGAGSVARVEALNLNNLTGRILLCIAGEARLYTLNGYLLLRQRVCDAYYTDDTVTCAAFYEGVGAEWVSAELLFTGHKRGGVVKVWELVNLDDGTWHLHLRKHLNHADPAREGVAGYAPPGIGAVLPRDKAVYVGDDAGHVWEWNCVIRHGR